MSRSSVTCASRRRRRRGFTQRAGLLFVGAIHTLDSPNYDGLGWLVDQVLPLIERALQWEARLTVVGYTGEEVSLDRFRHHPRVTLLGAVVHTECLYDITASANRMGGWCRPS